jgi:GNAT superfamily N-acetyltransferase
MSLDTPAGHDPIDDDYWQSSRLFMEVSHRGEAADARDLLLHHCGFPMVNLNLAHVKDPDPDPRDIAARAQDWFRARELPFLLSVRSDRAGRFAPALREAGWQVQPGIPALSLRLGAGHAAEPGAETRVAGLEIRRVRDDADLAAFQRTAFVGFGLPEPAARLYLTPELRDTPRVTLLLGLLDGRPACTSLVIDRGEVAGIYWVATLPEARRRGLGEAITWAAVRAGARAGCAVASLQASAMGRPIYERMGFAWTWDYARWSPPTQAAEGRAQ